MSAQVGLPFAHLNLRRNPFGELAADDRVAVAIPAFDLDPVVEHLRGPRAAAQVIGPCGRGKTTHLLCLRARLGPVPWARVAPDEPPPPLPEARPLVVDEVQLLSGRLRRRLVRGGGPLLLGTHVDYERELTRGGLRVLTLRVEGLTAERLAAIAARRIERARRAPGPIPRLTPAAAQALVARFGDDLRAIEHFLYERLQRQREPGDVEV